jgi:hypothetical protein
MGAQALGWLGEKARTNKAVMDALKKAKDDKDSAILREKAKEALERLGS